MDAEKLFDSRRQIRRFNHIDIPDKTLIQNLLDKTWRLVPSKQQLMPYKVFVLGPDRKKEKEIIFDQSTIVEEKQNPDVKYNSGQCTNIFAPYVLIFTPRLSKGSPAVRQRIKDGQTYTVCDPEKYRDDVQITSIEIGMFASVLTYLCRENEIDVSYNKNFLHWPQFKEYWKDLPFVDDPPYLLMSLGYRRYKDKPIQRPLIEEEYKENIDEIINWI